jgi:hypothetical protein
MPGKRHDSAFIGLGGTLQTMTENDSGSQFNDADLLAYLDGEVDPEVASQIERSPAARERAEELARLQSRLTARLYRMECPKSETLGEYHLGLLSQSKSIEVAKHLLECPHCVRELDQLRGYLSERAFPLKPDPFKGIKVLIARWVREKGGSQSTGELAFAPALAMLRGSSQGPLSLEADGILIILDIQPAAEERVTILGQVAADEQDLWTGSTIEVRQEGVGQCTAVVDDLGAFSCGELSPGQAELLLISKSGTIVLANIEIII